MDINLIIKLIEGIGLSIGIGLAFLIIPFALLTLIHMLPWLLSKIPFIRGVLFHNPIDGLNKWGNKDNSYIYYCHPAQVIKRLRNYGPQSLFRDYDFPKTPIQEQDKLSNENIPVEFLKSTNPVPINNKVQHGIDISSNSHDENLSQGKDHVNQKQTEPSKRLPGF